MKKFYNNGLQFHCTQCSHCCRGESGYVFLSKKDLLSLSHFLQLDEKAFLEKHARLVPYSNKLRLSLLEIPETDGQMRCEFWDNGCSVYEARPTQCRTYPFWAPILASQANWNLEASSCPGIGKGDVIPESQIDAMLEIDKDNPLIQIDP